MSRVEEDIATSSQILTIFYGQKSSHVKLGMGGMSFKEVENRV